MNKKEKDDSVPRIVLQVERMIRHMVEDDINEVPLQTPGPNSCLLTKEVEGVEVPEVASHHLRKALALQEILKQGSKILDGMIVYELEKFSFEGAPVFYEGWRLGSEKQEDLFKPSEEGAVTPKPRRNGDDIKLDAGALH